MSRIALLPCVLVTFVSVPLARAQQVPPLVRSQPVTGTVRDAGVLHLVTNTWTRKSSQASLGADTIYDNTCSSGYFSPLSGFSYVDEGRVPSPSGPSNQNAQPGCALSYRADGFQIGYCTDRPVPGPFQVRFYESYITCSQTTGLTPNAQFILAGLPGGPSTSSTCWTVTIDLGAPPGGTAMSFAMLADGGGGSPNTSRFGWSFGSGAPASEQMATGPIIAGDFSTCSGFDGTRWDPVVDYAEQGTGMGTADMFRLEGPWTGCYFFGGDPLASFHLELYADACPTQSAGADYCNGDGSATACPCGNASIVGEHGGCLNSLGQSGRLRADGLPSLANDTLSLFTAGLPPNAPLLFFQGTARTNNGLGQTFGDGLRCAGGAVTRLGTRAADAGGSASLPSGGSPPLAIAGSVTSPGVRTYQGWYRNSAAFCTAATFNLTNGWEVTWAP